MRLLIVFSCLTLLMGGINAQSSGGVDYVKKAISIYDDEGIDKTLEYVSGINRPITTMQVYIESSNHVYWQRHQLADYIKMAREGLGYGDRQSERVKAKSTQDYRRVQSWTQALSYNLAVNLWRGWNNKGITINDKQVSVGLDAANRNIEMVRRLKFDAAHQYKAFWIKGALELSQKKFKDALMSFGLAKSYALKTRDALLIINAELYAAYTKSLVDPALGAAEVDSLIEQLNHLEGGKAYSGQFETARHTMFVKN